MDARGHEPGKSRSPAQTPASGMAQSQGAAYQIHVYPQVRNQECAYNILNSRPTLKSSFRPHQRAYLPVYLPGLRSSFPHSCTETVTHGICSWLPKPCEAAHSDTAMPHLQKGVSHSSEGQSTFGCHPLLQVHTRVRTQRFSHRQPVGPWLHPATNHSPAAASTTGTMTGTKVPTV